MSPVVLWGHPKPWPPLFRLPFKPWPGIEVWIYFCLCRAAWPGPAVFPCKAPHTHLFALLLKLFRLGLLTQILTVCLSLHTALFSPQAHHDQVRHQQHTWACGAQSKPADGVRQPGVSPGLLNCTQEQSNDRKACLFKSLSYTNLMDNSSILDQSTMPYVNHTGDPLTYTLLGSMVSISMIKRLSWADTFDGVEKKELWHILGEDASYKICLFYPHTDSLLQSNLHALSTVYELSDSSLLVLTVRSWSVCLLLLT